MIRYMSYFVHALLLFVMIPCAVAAMPFKVDKLFTKSKEGRLNPDTVKYIGRATISGKYEFDMRGDVVFVPTIESARLLPDTKEELKRTGEVEIFLGKNESIKGFALNKAIKQVDGERICSFSGFARIEITELQSDIHEDHRIFFATLVRVLERRAPHFGDCKGVEYR